MKYDTKSERNASLGSGDSRICIAILDGPVDVTHPCFRGAKLEELDTVTSCAAADKQASAHGTHVTSIIFGQPDTEIDGIAPSCSGLIIPIFSSEDKTSESGLYCSQLDLARAILLAVEHGAHIINISAGQLSKTPEPSAILAHAIETCTTHNVLIVAAAGNDGCECIHLPAAASAVLAVGAMDGLGSPLPSSNWGQVYRNQGILAPGVDILGAKPGGGVTGKSGTSFATPIVSGLIALIASLQIKQGRLPDLYGIRNALLKTAITRPVSDSWDRKRILAGYLNLAGLTDLINPQSLSMESTYMNDTNDVAPVSLIQNSGFSNNPQTPTLSSGFIGVPNDQIRLSECNCNGGAKKCECGSCESGGQSGERKMQKPGIVYALGKIGYDFGSESRRDSFIQSMPAQQNNPYLANDLLSHLKQNPYDASSIIWTLSLDATPIYAIHPAGPFAATAYERLREFLDGQYNEGVELVSIPGTIAGSVRLQSGQVLPIVIPEIRGMFSWATETLVQQSYGVKPDESDKEKRESYERVIQGLTDYLNRVYYDLRNLGLTAEERAVNFSATNAFQVADVIRRTTMEDLDLDTFLVKKSPICRPESDCYDVELSFFNPNNISIANRVYRFTIDVSDVIPVSIGETRTWTKRTRP